MSKYVKKLGSDSSYKRPKKTLQEQLSADEITEKLQGYTKVDDISEVPLNTHIRYFTKDDNGNKVFRLGGFLHKKNNADTYVMLSNGKSVWSVQIKNTIFYKKLSHKEEIDALTDLYEKKLEEKDQVIKKLKDYIKLKIKKPEIQKNPQIQNPNYRNSNYSNPVQNYGSKSSKR